MTPEQELELFDAAMEVAKDKRNIYEEDAEEEMFQGISYTEHEAKEKCEALRKECAERKSQAKARYDKEESSAYDELSQEAMILWRRRLDDQKSSG